MLLGYIKLATGGLEHTTIKIEKKQSTMLSAFANCGSWTQSASLFFVFINLEI